jgi:hypothetical protein
MFVSGPQEVMMANGTNVDEIINAFTPSPLPPSLSLRRGSPKSLPDGGGWGEGG